jgi:hypothetical protein
MKVVDVTDRLSELSWAISGLGLLVYSHDPIPATGREFASLLALVQREIEAMGEVIAELRLAPMM